MKIIPLLITPAVFAAALASPAFNHGKSSRSLGDQANTYDYIVTGSGPGGGTIATNLARAGYSVLLIEAGDDQSDNIATRIHALTFADRGPTSWHFFVRHSDDAERTKRYNLLVWRLNDGQYWVGHDPASEGHEGADMLGVFYPRGATLGGSAIVNAAVALLPSDSDWDFFDQGVGDGIWNGQEMRRIFERIEHNNYLEPGAPGHGFTGWLETNIADRRLYPPSSPRLSVLKAGLRLLGKDPSKIIDYLVSDGNYADPKRDETEGLWALPFHVGKTWGRFSPRDYILATRKETSENGTQKYPLHLQLNSLTTRILFDEASGENGAPKAVGVEFLEGVAVYEGDPRHNSTTKGVRKQAFARKEVIISGGTFSSPQLLQLSGIGPKDLLAKFNISVISDLPGVGRNLQDNYELPVVGHARTSLADPADPEALNCTFGAPGDPCVQLWEKGEGPYSRAGGNPFGFLIKTQHAVEGERDMLLFPITGAALRGFQPRTNQSFPVDPPSTLSWSTVKIHVQNKAGVVQIKSANPQDMPDINFNHFVDGAEIDVGAILDTVAWARKGFFATDAPFGPLLPVEPPCPAQDIREDGFCKDVAIDREWIENQIFGHHPTSTNSVGPDYNPMAVLDTRLRVRGVQRLRVVDASAFPRCPGAFPALATFMLSERATELVLEDATAL